MQARWSFVLLFGLLSMSCTKTDLIGDMSGEWYGKIQVAPRGRNWTVSIFDTTAAKSTDDELQFKIRVMKIMGGNDVYRVSIRRGASRKYFISIALFDRPIISDVPLERSSPGFAGEITIPTGEFAGKQTASIKPSGSGFLIALAGTDPQKEPWISYTIRLSRTQLSIGDRFE